MELVLHRPVRQAQPRCDLPVGETSRREAGDLKLRGGEGSPSRNGGGEGRCSGTLAASGQHAGAWLRRAAVRSGARPRLHRRRPQQREALHHTRRRPRSSTQVPEHPPTRGQRRGRREPARVDLRRPRQAPVSEGRGSPTHCEPTAATACHGRPRPTPRRVAPQSSPGPQQAQPEPRNKEKRPCLHGAFLDRLVVFGSTECITWCRYDPDGSGGPVSWRCAARPRSLASIAAQACPVIAIEVPAAKQAETNALPETRSSNGTATATAAL